MFSAESKFRDTLEEKEEEKAKKKRKKQGETTHCPERKQFQVPNSDVAQTPDQTEWKRGISDV